MIKDHQSGPANPPTQRRHWRRWILRIVIALLVYTVLGFFVIPLVVRSVAVSQLRKLLGREVVIEKVRLNPYSFAAEVDGFAVKDPDGEPLLAWQQVRVDFQFTSIFHGPWRIQKITVVQPSVRAQINPDYSYNFSDLIEKFGQPDDSAQSTNAPSALPAVVIDQFEVREANATYADLTTSTPFRRRVQPVNLRATNFSTAPGHTNAFELRGASDAGGQFSFSGAFLLTPPEILGQFDLEGVNLTNFTALYEDFVLFRIRDGSMALSTEAHIRLGSSNRLAQATNTRFTLESLKVGLRDTPANLAELDQLSVLAPSAEAWEREAHVREVLIDGLRLEVHRRPDASFEFLEAVKPLETTNTTPGSARLAITAFTNVLAMFSGNTNIGSARLDTFLLTNTAVHFLDESTPEPVQATISDITASVQNVTTLPDAAPTARISLAWQTNGTLALEVQAKTTPPTLEVAVDLENWDLAVGDAYLRDFANARLEQLALSLRSRAHLEAPHGAEPSGQLEAEIRLSGLKTTHGSNNANLLLWDELSIRGIKANLHPMEAFIDQIQLDRPQLWGSLHADGTVNLLTAANLTNAVVAPSSSSDASSPPAASPASSGSTPTPPAEPDASSVGLPPVSLASLVLTNAALHLSDLWTEPNARITVSPLNGVLNHLSTTNLQSGDFRFTGNLEPAGSFTIEGQVRPLDGPEITRVQLLSDGIDLTPTDPYFQRFLGYALNRGSVSTRLDYAITQRQLAATNHVMLDQLTLGAKVDSPDAIKAPVKLGINLLKDRDGRIELTVPLTGSIDDPQFNIGKVITDAFATVFTKVITSPFSILGGLVGGAEEEELDHLEFAPGESSLTPDLVEQAAKIEKILYERPALILELLGTADPAQDGVAFNQARPDTQPSEEQPKPQAESEFVPVRVTPEPIPAAGTASGLSAHEEYARALARRFLESRVITPPTAPSEAQSAETQTATTPIATTEFGETELRQLAQQRAEAVRSALLESGRIDPSRITVRELTGPPPIGTEVRLNLQ